MLLLALYLQDVEALIKALTETKVDVEYKATPLAEAVFATLKKAELSAGVDDDVKDDPIWKHAPIDLTLRGVTVRSALRVMMRPYGFALVADGGRLLVTTKQKARPDLEFKKYDVAGLIGRLNDGARDPEGARWREKWMKEGHEKMNSFRMYPQNAVLDPEVGFVSDGVSLDTRPIVTSDRRFVMLEMRPISALLEPKPPAIATIQVPIGMSGTGDKDAPPIDEGFGRRALEEMIRTHFGGDTWDDGGSLSTIEGSLWVRQTPRAQAQIERFLRILADLK